MIRTDQEIPGKYANQPNQCVGFGAQPPAGISFLRAAKRSNFVHMDRRGKNDEATAMECRVSLEEGPKLSVNMGKPSPAPKPVKPPRGN